MIGGAAYEFPKYYVENCPEAEIDVVEIDPEVTELAKEYFNLEKHNKLFVNHIVGVIYLNN